MSDHKGASVQARHSRSCAIQRPWTTLADSIQGCSCPEGPTFYVAFHRGGLVRERVGKNRAEAERAAAVAVATLRQERKAKTVRGMRGSSRVRASKSHPVADGYRMIRLATEATDRALLEVEFAAREPLRVALARLYEAEDAYQKALGL